MEALNNILRNFTMQSQHGDVSVPVTDLQFDSRKVTEGSCFVATRGTITDGHFYINKAIEKGAKSVVCEELPVELIDNVTYVVVENSSEALGQMAANFYDHP